MATDMEESKQKFTVVEDKTLGEGAWDKRYIVVDTETGEVLDNAQGYGYKSIQNAYKAYGYKSKHKNPKQHSKMMKKKVLAFIKNNNKVFDELSDIAFYAAKDGEELTETQIKDFLKEHNVELPFTYKELRRYW